MESEGYEDMPKVKEAESAQEFVGIGQAAERTGLTQRTLRYYEELGLLKPPARITGGQRLYSAEDLARVAQIKRMRDLLGFSLSEIKMVVEAEEAKRFLAEDAKHERSRARKAKRLQEAADITSRQLQLVGEKVTQMQAMKKELTRDLATLQERITQLQQEGTQES